MATAKVLANQVRNLEEEIQQKQNLLKELKNKYNVQESKERTQRRIDRAKMLENLIEESDTLTDDQMKLFLEKTIQTNFARKILTELNGQNAAEQTTVQSENGKITGETGD